MRVAVLGATGVFGSRLVRMLHSDGHDVIAVSRRGTGGLALDRAGDLGPLWALLPDAVVDAAGPFHAYGGNRYDVARQAVAQGVHYLDLADDAVFCAGITVLDDAARAAGVVVLSGVSSVPCLSGAAVAALAEGIEIDMIETAILPGNRAPRGRAVVEGILARAGAPFVGWVDGSAEPVRNWSGPALVDLAPGDRRRAWQIEVPDQRLFPGAFGARTVVFRAGLELGVMGWGLAALSWIRARAGLKVPVGPVLAGAKLLERFGTDTGGMVVAVTGRAGGRWVRRHWRLVVRQGDGPFIPGVAARAVLRDIAAVPPGARPAVDAVTLAQAEAAMAGLAVTVDREAASVVPLFTRVPGFDALPGAVRATHDHAGPRRFAGRARVERGRGPGAILAALFGFPPAATDVAVEVVKTPVEGGEVWERRFGDRRFRSHLWTTPRGIAERFGPFAFDLGLAVRDGGLDFPVVAGRFLGLPLPRALLPVSQARETEEGGQFRFDVALRAPLGLGLMVRYRGWLASVPPAG